ncbi:MAG: ParB N-terminal domain-containing protein [Planctomycetes bacterium]|nr:ParB N-terminal domain-containing protein [Planctomycetota bacterium]
MKKPRRKRRIEDRPIDSLKPHPSQPKLFDDLSGVELQCLADDIKKNGLRNAVEILTDGTIIAGHQRVRAVQLLGRTKIRCWIREDLEQQGDAAIEARLIEDNLHRRQLSRLGVARCYLRLKEMERGGYYAEEEAQGDLRDHLAKRFGVKGRSLDRYARILKAPVAVQYAFDRGPLTQSQVLGVVGLEPEQQQEIANRIEDGEEPTSVVKEYLTSKIKSSSALAAVSRLIRELDRGLADLKRKYKRIKGHMWGDELKVLADAEKFIPALRRHLDQQNKRSKEKMSRSPYE